MMRNASELTFIQNILSILGWSTSDPTAEAIDNISDNSTGNRRSQLVRNISASMQSSIHALDEMKGNILTKIIPKSSNKVTPSTDEVEGQ